tara:strand:+ start:3237 stop:3371 length:135 start_codon:yes stop_codon:yes gene_type:complete
MGIENPKLRLLALVIINILVIATLRYWLLSGSSFFWLREGLPSG